MIHESEIPVSRLTVTSFAIFGDGPKWQLRNEVVTPDGDSATAEHTTSSIKTCLREGFSNGWAKGWRHCDFSKPTMACMEICKKMLPNCLWLWGYLEGHKQSPEQYQTSGKFKGKCTKFADPFSWKFLAYSWGVGDKECCRSLLASAIPVAQDRRSKEVIEIDILASSTRVLFILVIILMILLSSSHHHLVVGILSSSSSWLSLLTCHHGVMVVSTSLSHHLIILLSSLSSCHGHLNNNNNS